MVKKKKFSKKNIFWILLVATILDLLIPDFIPVIDEIILSVFTIKQGIEVFR